LKRERERERERERAIKQNKSSRYNQDKRSQLLRLCIPTREKKEEETKEQLLAHCCSSVAKTVVLNCNVGGANPCKK